MSQVANLEFGLPRRRRLRIPDDATQIRWVYPLIQKGARKQHDIELAVWKPPTSAMSCPEGDVAATPSCDVVATPSCDMAGTSPSGIEKQPENPAPERKWEDQMAVISFLEVGGWMLLDDDNQ